MQVAIVLSLLTATISAQAALRIEVSKGQIRGIPVAIVPFAVEGTTTVGQDIAAIIEADLTNSGRFEPIPRTDHLSAPSQPEDIKFKDFRLLKAEAMVIGRVIQEAPDNYRIEFRLFDVFQGAEGQLEGGAWSGVEGRDLRKLAHRISDVVYEKLTGVPGAFETLITYVARNGTAENRVSALVVSDYDGDTSSFPNGGRVLETPPGGIILSPSWSPDGQAIAYLKRSDSNFGWELILHRVYEDRTDRLVETTSYVGAPSWSPDGTQIAYSSSDETGNSDLYVIDLASNSKRRLTDNLAIDTQPSWYPDGTRLVFTSNRSGKPQVYEISANGGQASRLTFDGKENHAPMVSPDGKKLVLITNQGNGHQAAIYDLASRQTLVLNPSSRNDERASFSPNGAMVIYSTKSGGKASLRGVSVDGRFTYKLPSTDNEVMEPAWSPFLRK